MICNHDDVAEWDGEPRGQKQRLAQTDGDYAQRATSSRFWTWQHRSDTQPVSSPQKFDFDIYVT